MNVPPPVKVHCTMRTCERNSDYPGTDPNRGYGICIWAVQWGQAPGIDSKGRCVEIREGKD